MTKKQPVLPRQPLSDIGILTAKRVHAFPGSCRHHGGHQLPCKIKPGGGVHQQRFTQTLREEINGGQHAGKQGACVGIDVAEAKVAEVGYDDHAAVGEGCI